MSGFNFASNGFIATVDVATESMTTGKYYQFVYKSTNMIGDSELSKVIAVTVADIPS